MWAVSGKYRERITLASATFDAHPLLAQTQDVVNKRREFVRRRLAYK
jgi:hypothetical protein